MRRRRPCPTPPPQRTTSPPSFLFNSGQYLQENSSGGALSVALPPGVTAVGFDVSSFLPQSAIVQPAGLTHDFRPCYLLLSSLGRRAEGLARRVLLRVALVRLAGRPDRLLSGLDDAPTRRYGPCAEGAGAHHDPTPGPAD